jgi:predicted metalloprotease
MVKTSRGGRRLLASTLTAVALVGLSLATAPGAGAATGSIREADPDVSAANAFTLAQGYWRATQAKDGQPFTPVAAVHPYAAGDGRSCGTAPYSPNNAYYCPADHTIAYDRAWQRRQHIRIGDAFTYFLIGHEYGHAVQRMRGHAYMPSRDVEVEADCYSGAFLGDEYRAGRLQLDQGDFTEFTAGMRSIGDPAGTPWFDPNAHGTGPERVQAFWDGFAKGHLRCSDYAD